MKSFFYFLTFIVVFVGLFYPDLSASYAIAPVVLASIIGAGSSLIGSGINAASQSSANSTNIQAQREANEMNYRIHQEDLEENRRLLAEERAYNDPSAQRSRYEAAGFNPYMMLGNMESGNVQSHVAQSASPMGAAHVQSVRAGDGLIAASNSIQNIAQVQAIEEQTKNQKIKNRFEALQQYQALERSMAETQELLSRKDLTDAQRKDTMEHLAVLRYQSQLMANELKYSDDYFSARSDKERNLSDLARNQAQTELFRSEYERQLSEAFPKVTQAQLNLLSAQAADAVQGALLKVQQGELTAQEAKTEALRTFGERLNNLSKSNKISLESLDIDKRALEAARTRDIVNARKNSRFFRKFDSSINNLFGSFGRILGNVRP